MNTKLFAAAGACALSALALVGIRHLAVPAPTEAARPATPWVWNLPKGFPVPRVPADNPMSEAKFELGRHLFYDKRLSGNGTMGCGSCHFQDKAFTDGRALSTGSTGDQTARSAMGIANVAYYPTLTWDNPSQISLELQAAVPMFVENLAVELGITDENKAAVLERFRSDATYRKLFKEAFADQPDAINFLNIIKAIATFERGVVSGNSRYDRAVAGELQLTAQEERGRQLFFGAQGQCSQCHSGFNFSDQTMHAQSGKVETPFHNTGLYNVDGKGAYPDDNPGVIGVMPQAESNHGKFRVPSLRNIELTAPYMHDGSIPTLEAVLDFYGNHGRNITSGPHQGDGRRNPFKDPLIDKIRLSAKDKADLIAFLKTLTDTDFIRNPRFSDPFKQSS